MFSIVPLELQSGEFKSGSRSGPHVGARRTPPCLEHLCSPVGAYVRVGGCTSKDSSERRTSAHSPCRSLALIL